MTSCHVYTVGSHLLSDTVATPAWLFPIGPLILGPTPPNHEGSECKRLFSMHLRCIGGGTPECSVPSVDQH